MAQADDKMGGTSAEQAIRDLADQHGVQANRTGLDQWADDVTRLVGDDVTLDDVEELIVALRQAGGVDGAALTRLHSQYLDERIAENV